jgi:hypothetical protein
LNKYLKYIISLFLVFALIANDGTLDSQAKSADYYQSSYVILKREIDFKDSQFYVLGQFISLLPTSFSIPVLSPGFAAFCSLQIRILLKLQEQLYQNLTSFIRQSVFINEIITSNNLNKSLYKA